MARTIPLSELPVFSASSPPEPGFPWEQGAAFLINKPKGWTSFDVVKFLRKCLDMRKIGHAGTLDPMAEGLLILCCGRGTKSISQFQEASKKYIGDVVFGAATASYDAETDVTERKPADHLTREMVEETLDKEFSGQIVQVPPMYSALKHKGQPLYKLARKGKEVQRKPRQVVIHETKILECKLPRLKLYIHCSKGTYIRCIARDLAREMNTVGHLTGLIRTAIGDYKAEDALTTDQLESIFING